MKRSIGRNYTVAGDTWREGVDAERSPNGLRRFAADLSCDPAIGRDFPMWNTRGCLVDLHLKGGGLRSGFHIRYFIIRRYGGASDAEFDFRCISNRQSKVEST